MLEGSERSEVMPLPQTGIEFLWWAFQAAFLLIVWFMKRDLGEIKADGKANRIMNEATAANAKEHKGICEERHRRLDLEISQMRQRRSTDDC